MTTEISTPAPIRVGAHRGILRRLRSVVPLSVALLAIFAASAQAHSVTATATCKSVTFSWESFSSSGSGNGGLNTPKWVIVFVPVSGSTTTTHGTASFAGSSTSLTVAIPSGNGVVTASSSWSSAETRDGYSNSMSGKLTIADCPVAPVTPVKPAPPTPLVSVGPPASAVRVPVTVALSTEGSAGVMLGGAIRDTAVLSGGSSPTGTITFSLYSANDPTCANALHSVTVAVNGDGSYVSPPVTPTSAGSYQWVAIYDGDQNNQRVAASCNDPTELSNVAAPVCVRSPIRLRGFTETVGSSLSASLPASGIKLSCMVLTAPQDASVVTTVNSDELAMPNRTSLPSMLPPACEALTD